SGGLTQTANLSLTVQQSGASWTAQTSGTGNPLYGVTYGNGTFVAVGLYGTILTSP
ncbi:MAG: cell wall-binding protein, partial [Meiothermus sp.]